MEEFSKLVSDHSEYKWIELDISELSKKDMSGKKLLDWFNKSIGKTDPFKKLKDIKGVYAFVVGDKPIKIEGDFFEATEAYAKTDGGYVDTQFNFASPKTGDYPKDGVLKPDYIVYSGKKEEDLLDRVREHITNCQYNGNRCLRLGFPSRAKIRDKLKCYIALVDNPTKAENVVHSYGRYFGE